MATKSPTQRIDKSDASGPATARAHYHHGDLPAALKTAALTLITRHGVEGFSLREAAMLVGVSPSAAYRHFEDKAALLKAIANDAFVDMGQRFDEAMRSVRGASARAARARFMAQGHAYVTFALEQPERFAVMFGPHGFGSQKNQPTGKTTELTSDGLCKRPQEAGPYAALTRVLDEMMEYGVIHPARRKGAELIAWSAIHGLSALLVSDALTLTGTSVEAMVLRIGSDCIRALKVPDDS